MPLMGECVRYYVSSRTHLSPGNCVPDGQSTGPLSVGPIRSRPEIGWLHRSYHREAA